MKKAMSSLSWIGIILVLIILITLFISVTNLYGGTSEIIKKFLGEKTESEITHEKNIQAEKYFKNLEEQIVKCIKSKEKTCGCSLDLKEFNSNYKIDLTGAEMKLVNIKNQESDGIQMASFVNPFLNCYWNKNLKPEPLKVIHFKENPFIIEERVWWIDSEYNFVYKFNILKINDKLCWLADNVDENKISTISECK